VVNQIELLRTPFTWKLTVVSHFALIAQMFTLLYYEQDTRRGLQSVRKICKEHNISGVHGPLAELLECDEKFFTALEVTAGSR
jgi:hypothetical protein